SAYALRRADPLGSVLHDFRMAWRYVRGPRQLRVRICAMQAGGSRTFADDDDAHGADPIRVDEGRYAVAVGNVPRMARQSPTDSQRGERRKLRTCIAADGLCDGIGSCEESPGYAGRA